MTSAAIPGKEREREEGDQSHHAEAETRPLEALADASTDSQHGAWRGLEVSEWNPLGDQDAILKCEAFIADFRDHSGAYFSTQELAMNELVFVDAKLLNFGAVGNLFGGQGKDRPR